MVPSQMAFPNPILVENRDSTRDAVIQHGADMGIAWDGDFDRCFLFDEKGQFIEGYYIVGLLAQAFLLKQSGEKIVHDPRLSLEYAGCRGAVSGDLPSNQNQVMPSLKMSCVNIMQLMAGK